MKSRDSINHNEDFSENDVLSGLKRKDVFSVPANYFEKLPIEISDKISSQKTAEKGVLFTFPKLVMAAAVVIAVIVTGSMYYLNSGKSEKSQVVLTYDDLIQSGIAYEYDDLMLMEHYYSFQNGDNPVNDSANVHNSMNDYLIEDNIDITLIINEL